MKHTFLIFAGLFSLTLPVLATMQIPVKLQAALFRKILSYDKVLKGKSDKLVVALVGESSKQAQETSDAFESVGFKVVSISADKLEQAASSFDVLYINSDSTIGIYKELCEQKGLLTITGNARLVEKGHVSIGLETKDDGRPQIVINLKRLQAEKHELQSELLTLAKVIR